MVCLDAEEILGIISTYVFFSIYLLSPDYTVNLQDMGTSTVRIASLSIRELDQARSITVVLDVCAYARTTKPYSRILCLYAGDWSVSVFGWDSGCIFLHLALGAVYVEVVSGDGLEKKIRRILCPVASQSVIVPSRRHRRGSGDVTRVMAVEDEELLLRFGRRSGKSETPASRQA